MIAPIPKELLALYSPLGRRVQCYAKLRWRLCPFEEVAEHIPIAGTVVDVGCGFGLNANWLALRSQSCDVLGVDASPRRIGIAQQTVRNRSNISFRQHDLRDCQLPPCDAIVATDVLHHLPPDLQWHLLTHARSALRPGGKLVILDVDRNWWWWKYWCVYAIDRLLNWGAPLYHSTSAELERRVREAGFEVTITPVDRDLPLPDILVVGRTR